MRSLLTLPACASNAPSRTVNLPAVLAVTSAPLIAMGKMPGPFGPLCASSAPVPWLAWTNSAPTLCTSNSVFTSIRPILVAMASGAALSLACQRTQAS
jgi:hypothetical protein